MWRTRAVERMLLEEIAGLGRRDAEDVPATDALATARRSAWRAVLVDWLALAVLLAVRLGETPLLALGPGVDVVFTVGLLLVAIHSGFRLGQLEKLRSVTRLTDELMERRQS